MEASRAATGMEEVLRMMMVRSIRLPPEVGSVISGYSVMVSTTSPARSPQATMITISTCALRAIRFCSTVLPAPNGPGIQAVPPRAMGKKVSIRRWEVRMGVSGNFRWALPDLSRSPARGRRTGQFCDRVSVYSSPLSPVRRATGSLAVTAPFCTQFTTKRPVQLNGSMIL